MSRTVAILATAMALGAISAGIAVAGATGGEATTVKVFLAPRGNNEKLAAGRSVAKAGAITFLVTNQSNIPYKSYGVPESPEVHELVVIRTNRDPSKLPLKNVSGSDFAIETGRVGKPLVLDPGKSGTLTLHLEPGKYVLICNLLGHYVGGQHAGLTVTR